MDKDANQGEGPRVVVSVLTWNDTEMTSNCVRSVLANDYRPLKVVVVDNGSREPCGRRVQEAFPEIDVVEIPENRGVARGLNTALRAGLDRDAEYVIFCGNDALLEPDSIAILVRTMEQQRDLGAAQPILLNPPVEGEGKEVQFYSATVDRDGCFHKHYNNGFPVAFDSRQTWPTVRTEFMPFVATMFRAQTLREVGLLDPSFGSGWEDYDFCIRLNDAGRPLATVGETFAYHLGSATTGRVSPYVTYYYVRNRLVCLFRYGKPLGILKRSQFTVRSFIDWVKLYGVDNVECHKAFARGVVDYFRGVRGHNFTGSTVDKRQKPGISERQVVEAKDYSSA